MGVCRGEGGMAADGRRWPPVRVVPHSGHAQRFRVPSYRRPLAATVSPHKPIFGELLNSHEVSPNAIAFLWLHVRYNHAKIQSAIIIQAHNVRGTMRVRNESRSESGLLTDKVMRASALGAVAMLCAWSARAESNNWLEGFVQANYVDMLALIPACALLGLLTVIVGIDAYIRPEQKRIMRLIIAVVFSLVTQNYIEYRLAAGELRWLARTLASIYGYAIRPVILVLFLRLIVPRGHL